jgi:lysyl-tRNA synthetase class 2
MAPRHGQLAFLSLQDESGSIQLYCEKLRLGDAGFDALKSSLDVGDIGRRARHRAPQRGAS